MTPTLRFTLPVAVSVLGALACAGRPARGASGATGTVRVEHAVVSNTMGTEGTSAFLIVRNEGSAADSLVGVSCDAAQSVTMHIVPPGGGMQPVAALPLPAGASVPLAEGKAHLMLSQLSRVLAAGDTVSLEFTFARAGRLTLRVPVLRYGDAVEEVQGR